MSATASAQDPPSISFKKNLTLDRVKPYHYVRAGLWGSGWLILLTTLICVPSVLGRRYILENMRGQLEIITPADVFTHPLEVLEVPFDTFTALLLQIFNRVARLLWVGQIIRHQTTRQ